MIVTISVGKNGISTLLVISQVVLSIILPFVTLPLVYLTSSSRIMKVGKPHSSPVPAISGSLTSGAKPTSVSALANTRPSEEVLQSVERPCSSEAVDEEVEYVDFSSGKIMTCIGSLIWLVIVAANIYALVTLGLGQ